MKIQTNYKTLNTNCAQSFTGQKIDAKDSKKVLTAVADKTLASDCFNALKNVDYESFVRKFEAKYIAKSKANFEYLATNNLRSLLKFTIADFKYKRFVSKKENQENCAKLYGYKKAKFKKPFIHFAEFLRMHPINIACYFTGKKVLNKKCIIDGKKISQRDISKIIAEETNPEIRKKAYDSKYKLCDNLKDDIIDIVKKRNAYAQAFNYSSYFDLILKRRYNTDLKAFNKNLESTYLLFKPELEKVHEENEEKLKKVFQTETLEYYHYNLNNSCKEYKVLDNAIEKIGVLPLAKKIFSKMGFDIDKLINEGKLIIHNDKKEKRSFHMSIMPGKISGICVSLKNDFFNLAVLCHELGHAMYNLGTSQTLPINMRTSPSQVMNEGIAMMMEDVTLNKDIWDGMVPTDILEKIKKNRRKGQLIRIARNFILTEFEQEMYANPNQDLAKLWQEKYKKFTGWNYKPSNEWSTADLLISAPAYTHNYIKAQMIAFQLHKHLKTKLGNLTENKETAKYLSENIFSKGASINETELLKKITRKENLEKDFLKDINFSEV